MQGTELLDFLRQNKIPLHKWGKGVAKTVERLEREIAAGETKLERQPGGAVFRIVQSVGVNVFAHHEGKSLVLYEEKQTFPDGRESTRDLTTSIGEKLKPGEEPEDAAYRALAEELGIKDEPRVLWNFMYGGMVRKKGPVRSDSYPGLWSVYTVHEFEFIMPEKYFRAEGYREERPDQVTVFKWKEIGAGAR